MAQFFVPSKQIFVPELLVPGEKPRGLVEINKNHPSARGLTSYKIFSRAHGITDLVDGSGGTVTGSVLNTDRPESVHCDIGADYIEFDKDPIAGFPQWSLLVRLEITSYHKDINRYIVGNYESANSSWGVYWGTAQNKEYLRFIATSNGISVIGLSNDQGDWQLYDPVTVVFTCNGSRVFAYSNAFGKRWSAADLSITASTLVDTYGYTIGKLWYSTTKEFNVYANAGWRRYMAPNEAWQLIENPYVLLNPASPEWISFDVGGAATKPALLMIAGQIKQYTDESPNRPLCINADGSVEGYLAVAGKKPLVVDTGDMRALGVGETLDR